MESHVFLLLHGWCRASPRLRCSRHALAGTARCRSARRADSTKRAVTSTLLPPDLDRCARRWIDGLCWPGHGRRPGHPRPPGRFAVDGPVRHGVARAGTHELQHRSPEQRSRSPRPGDTRRSLGLRTCKDGGRTSRSVDDDRSWSSLFPAHPVGGQRVVVWSSSFTLATLSTMRVNASARASAPRWSGRVAGRRSRPRRLERSTRSRRTSLRLPSSTNRSCPPTAQRSLGVPWHVRSPRRARFRTTFSAGCGPVRRWSGVPCRSTSCRSCAPLNGLPVRNCSSVCGSAHRWKSVDVVEVLRAQRGAK